MIQKGMTVEFIETENLPWIDIDEKNEFESAKKNFYIVGKLRCRKCVAYVELLGMMKN